MPPAASQKGTGKKAGSGVMRQRSRNSTPSSVPPAASLPPIEAIDADYLSLRVEQFRNIGYDDLVDHGTSNALVPDTKSVDGMIARLSRLQEVIDRRTNFCDKAMRDLASQRKNHVDEAGEAGEEVKSGKRAANKKKRKAADSLAPGDANKERSSPLRDSSKPRKHSRDESISSSLSPVEPASPSAMEVDEKKKVAKKEEEQDGEEEDEEEQSSSEDEGAPPRRVQPAAHTFGDDPSTFPDPTLYEIRDATPSMTTEELQELYSVAVFPPSDLADLIAGDPPDKDYSNAKPPNQINFSTFTAWVEPFFRSFGEEDLTFLRERSDRVTAFHLPKRGKKHYSEVWAEEDGAMQLDSSPSKPEKLAANQARGTIENMEDDVGESDKLSVGPLLSRLLQTLRPETRPQTNDDDKAPNSMANGDVSMNGENGEMTEDGAAANGKPGPAPPASFMTESGSEAWKKATHPKLDYAQVDERIKQELRHIGLLPLEPSTNGAGGAGGAGATANGHEPNGEFDGAFDDEGAARLRLLQARLREQALINGARRSRLTDLVRERMAHQEYQTILEDLDSQVNTAYQKRTRTMGKSKKAKRPGGAGGGSGAGANAGANGAAGMARPGIGDVTKMLMERRRRWINTIGSVFDDENMGKVPRVENLDSSIFKPGEMAELMRREKEVWDEEVEEE